MLCVKYFTHFITRTIQILPLFIISISVPLSSPLLWLSIVLRNSFTNQFKFWSFEFRKHTCKPYPLLLSLSTSSLCESFPYRPPVPLHERELLLRWSWKVTFSINATFKIWNNFQLLHSHCSSHDHYQFPPRSGIHLHAHAIANCGSSVDSEMSCFLNIKTRFAFWSDYVVIVHLPHIQFSHIHDNCSYRDHLDLQNSILGYSVCSEMRYIVRFTRFYWLSIVAAQVCYISVLTSNIPAAAHINGSYLTYWPTHPTYECVKILFTNH